MIFLRILGVVALVVLATVAICLVVLRPRSHRWGATTAELRHSMPGDELVPRVKVGYTQAITIDAPPEEVWPWLVQHGYRRAGFYSHEWVYRLLGSANYHEGDRSADRIIPELQNLRLGDQIKINETAAFEVVALEPNRLLTLLARVDLDTGETFELSETMPVNFMSNSWVYLLEEVSNSSTRLIVRWRGDYGPSLGNALALGIPTEAGALMMQPKMLRGIKARAERPGVGE